MKVSASWVHRPDKVAKNVRLTLVGDLKDLGVSTLAEARELLLRLPAILNRARGGLFEDGEFARLLDLPRGWCGLCGSSSSETPCKLCRRGPGRPRKA